ncbi:secreted RxLR effector protein 161-like [Nicotiana sylvestris]|uniref:secreted RxLR effector protein 161-like n=1 Tax=Nicotiana sylvestris TaxID=4096 RepID=UPI00388C5BFD
MVAAWGERSDEDSEGEDGDEQALMAIGESDEESEISLIHLKDKIKFLSKERLSKLLLDFVDESEDLNNKKEQLSKECVILKAKSKNLELRASESENEPGSSVDQNLYRGMIGSLLCLTTSRPVIMCSVGLCARFQANPKEFHLTNVKRILRYLKGTADLCLWYSKGSNFDLVGYVDANYVVFLVDRKSTSFMEYFLGSCLVSWATKRQNSVALSTAEAEYVVVAS